MARQYRRYDDWDSQQQPADVEAWSDESAALESRYDIAPYEDQRALADALPAPAMPSLVNVSATITNYGAPLLSYTKTMSRFYQTRKQVLSVGRFKCVICNERIGGWAWLGPDGVGHAHDGCYERLAWAWASVYSEQQQMANRGELD